MSYQFSRKSGLLVSSTYSPAVLIMTFAFLAATSAISIFLSQFFTDVFKSTAIFFYSTNFKGSGIFWICNWSCSCYLLLYLALPISILALPISSLVLSYLIFFIYMSLAIISYILIASCSFFLRLLSVWTVLPELSLSYNNFLFLSSISLTCFLFSIWS